MRVSAKKNARKHPRSLWTILSLSTFCSGQQKWHRVQSFTCFWWSYIQGWIKSRKNSKLSGMDFGNFKTVWQGESGELKTVCWFFKYCLLNFLNCFCVANCLIWLKVKKIEAYSSTFCSINALSINKDNPLLPLQSTTPVFVCQMRKSLKLSVRGEF